jgi:hypothetical protein
MPAEDTSNLPDRRARTNSPNVAEECSTEADMWAAELSFLSCGDQAVRSAQFAIRTAVRAQALALLAGTDAIDELLDARTAASTDLSRRVYDTAINHLRTERLLSVALRWPSH